MEWKKICICNNPYNPDKTYISCDICNKRYHIHHCKLKSINPNLLDKFNCQNCVKV